MLTATQVQQATKRRARMGWVRSVNKQRTQVQAQYTGTAAATTTGAVVRAKSRRVSNT